MSVPASTPKNNPSGTGLPWPLHPACAAWPEMSPSDLQALSDDIAVNGLRDPITLTSNGLLLDGRNRALACVMAGAELRTTVYDEGDPWLFSLSRNKHRRHLTTDQIAMVAATMATASHGGDRGNQHTGGKSSNEPLAPVSIAQAAQAASVPETAVKSAKVVLKHGTSKEIAAVNTGEKKLRPTADKVRKRERALAPPKHQLMPKSAKAASAIDPIEAVACDIISKCSDGNRWSAAKIASTLKIAESTVREALKSLEDAVEQRKNGSGVIEYRIAGNVEADLRRSLAAKDREIVSLKARIAEQDAEIERLRKLLNTPPPARSRAAQPAAIRKGRAPAQPNTAN